MNNFHGYKRGGLYKILGASNTEVLVLVNNDISDPKGFSLIFIPNNAVIMFLERLDDGNAMILYEDKKLELAFGTAGYLIAVS